MSEARIECPECGTLVPQDPGFTPWCACGWNLEPPGEASPRSLKERFYLRLGTQHGEALFERVRQTETMRPKASGRRFLLVVLSVCVILTTPLLLVGAVALVALTWVNLFAIAGGLFLAACAWLLRPRLFSIPAAQVLAPERHPNLERVVGELAKQVSAPRPAVLAASSDFNACVGAIGHSRKRGLVLGLPLMAVLESQEWIALLGHELGHLAHGDAARAQLTSTAIQTVNGWCEVLTPTSFWEQEEGPGGALAAIGIYVLSFLPRTLLKTMVHLSWSDSQLAEYHADRMAASVAGSAGARLLIDKLMLSGTCLHALHRVVHGKTSNTVLAEMASRARSLPPRERERLHRIASLETPVLDATHPPEGLRLRMLAETTQLPGTYMLSKEDRESIEAELAESAKRVESELVNEYQNALHGL